MKIEPIEAGRYYHIYNRGNNGADLFIDQENYTYFLNLYQKYVYPVVDTFSWCLMKNHFHFLVYIKEEKDVNDKHLSYNTILEPRQINASRQFSHLFNSYSQAFNKRFSRTGSLFEKPFERRLVDSEKYFTRLIYYIHNNPVHHGINDNISEYKWSSYHSLISLKPTKLKRDFVIGFFDTVQNFIYFHSKEHEMDDMGNLLID